MLKHILILSKQSGPFWMKSMEASHILPSKFYFTLLCKCIFKSSPAAALPVAFQLETGLSSEGSIQSADLPPKPFNFSSGCTLRLVVQLKGKICLHLQLQDRAPSYMASIILLP